MSMESKTKKPMRSLTDEEYEEIFVAALATPPEVAQSPEIKSDPVKDDFDAILEEETSCGHVEVGKGPVDDAERAGTSDDECEEEEEDVNTGDLATKKDEEESDEPVSDVEDDNMDAESESSGQGNNPVILEQPNLPEEISDEEKGKNVPPKVPMKRKASHVMKTADPGHLKHLSFRKPLGSHRSLEKVKEKNFVPNFSKSKMKKVSRKQSMQTRQIEQTGTWVQCSMRSCLKWRYLARIHDPCLLPKTWICRMNSDPGQNRCDLPEPLYDRDTHEADFVYSSYVEGSIVWAKMVGYPWWPGMIEIDPDFDVYFECRANSNNPTHYHVVFFAEKVSRAWLPNSSVRPFAGRETATELGSTKVKGHDYWKDISKARSTALEAIELSIQDRLTMYGFSHRFKGKWGAEVFAESSSERDDALHQKVLPKSERRHKKKRTRHVSEDGAGEQLELNLDSEEVNDILDQAESIINDADDILMELTGGEDSEYAPDSPARKKCKKLKKKKKKDKTTNENKDCCKDEKKKKKKRRSEGRHSEDKVLDGSDRLTVVKKKKKKDKHDATRLSDKENKNCSRSAAFRPSFKAPNLKKIQSAPSQNESNKVCESTVKGTTTFDSDVFTMELDDEEMQPAVQDKGRDSRKGESKGTKLRLGLPKPSDKKPKQKGKKFMAPVANKKCSLDTDDSKRKAFTTVTSKNECTKSRNTKPTDCITTSTEIRGEKSRTDNVKAGKMDQAHLGDTEKDATKSATRDVDSSDEMSLDLDFDVDQEVPGRLKLARQLAKNVSDDMSDDGAESEPLDFD